MNNSQKRRGLVKRSISLMLVFSMLLSLSVTAFAVEKPAVDHDGMTIFVGDVRVEKKDTKNSVEIDAVITAGSDYATVRGGTLNFDIDSTTTGINATDTLDYGTAGKNDVRMISADEGLTTTGKGAVSFAQGKVNPLTIKLTLPNVTATTKINVSGTGMYITPPTAGKEIDSSKIKVVSGFVIVQYPVTVTMEGTAPTGASATVKTTEHDTGKATYDASGATTTPLTINSTFWVDSGAGQQNTPALDLTAPAGYKAEVKVGNGDWQLAGKNFSIGEVKAATAVSIRYTQTTADTVTISVTDKYGEYQLGTWEQHGEKHATNKATVSAKPYTGYTAYAYSLNGGNQIDGTSVEVPLTGDQAVTFFYNRSDNSAVVPGKDNKFGTDDDVVIKPTDPDKTPTVDNTTGTVTVPNDTTGTVTRPKDPTNPGNGKEDIVVPGGTTVDKDGTIKLPQKPDGSDGSTIHPGDKLPENAPAGVVVVTYKANGGSGDDVMQVGDGSVKALGQQHTAPANKGFVNWNKEENGNGTKYEKDDVINTSTVLFAQWSNSPYTQSVEITFNSNIQGVTPEKQTIGVYAGTSSTENLRKNSFTYTGWTFGGWSKAQIGEIKYTDGQAYTFNKGDAATLNLHAQWYKQDGSSITVPGKDGDPSNADTNVTGAGNGITRNETTGVITIPNGGTITVIKNGQEETITLPNGGFLNPDGSYTINLPNGGKIDVDKDGKETPKDENGDPKPGATVVSLIYHINNGGDTDDVIVRAIKNEETTAIANPFTYEGHVFLNWMANLDGTVTEIAAGTGKFTPTTDSVALYAQWAKKNIADGSIELPGKDGVLEAPKDKDNVTVTPDEGGKVTPQPDGSVKVEDKDGTVTRPDPEKPDAKEDIKVPNGTEVKPDGTIKLPDGTEIGPDQKFPDQNTQLQNYVVITYDPNGGTGDVVKQIIAKDAQNTKTLAADTFTAPAGDVEQVFDKWVNAADENDTYAAEAPFAPAENVTLKALWKRKGITYKVDITLVSGTNVRVQRAEGNDKQFDATLRANPFTAPVEGWTFMGWTTDANGGKDGTFYKDQDSIQLDVTKNAPTLYAIWYKADAASGTITLPGKGNDPTTTGNNVTVNLGTGANPPTVKNNSGEGFVEAGAGNTIVQPTGTITVKEGTVKVYPDGTVEIPKGSKVTDKDGNEVTGPATIDPDGKTDPGKKDDPKKDDTNNSIIIPGKDGFIDPPHDKDNLIVKPDGNGNATGRIDPDTGNTTITAPDGADVSIPGTNPPDTRADIKLPEGTVIKPDGTIILPDGKDGKDNNGGTIPGGSEIDKDGVVTYKYTVVYLDENDRALERPTYVSIKTGETRTVQALNIPGYTVVGDARKEVTAGPNDPSNYTITFKYEKVVDTLTVTPANVEAKPGDQLTFTAKLNGADTTDVTWSITGATSANTTIDENTGSLTIGADEAKNKVLTVTATSKTDPNLTASTTVTVKADPIPPTGFTLTVTPNSAIVNAGKRQSFTALKDGTPTQNVVWTVTGGNGSSSIDANGVLTVGSSEADNTILTITATSTEGGTVTAVAYVTVRVENVNPPAPNPTPITPSVPSKPSQREDKPNNSGVADPSMTGVAGWLNTVDHIVYMNGIGGGQFAPNANMTRAQVAQMFYNLLWTKESGTPVTFSDVPAGKWYTTAVNVLASHGIITGSNGKFRPNDPITRAEFVAIAMRFARQASGATASFTDVSRSAWYYSAVASAVSYGWIGGYSDGTFRPTKSITRAEVVTIVNRMLGRSFDTMVDSGRLTRFVDVAGSHWAFSNIAEATTAHDYTNVNGVETWTK